MNSKALNNALYDVAARTFEALALMFLTPDEDVPSPVRYARAASVTFTGAFDGRLVLAVSRGILKELAANMLGVEHASPTPEQQDDALKEMVNVVCGNLLPVLAGPQPVFHMSAPEIGPVHGAADQGERPSAATARMCVDAGAAELSLFVNDPAALEAAATAHTEKACI